MSAPASLAFAASSPDGRATICVVVKRAIHSGMAQPSLCLAEWPEVDAARFPVMAGEPDIWPIKLATDIVVTGSVHAPAGGPVRRMEASVRVGAYEKRIAVIGNRTAKRRTQGWLFSDPEPFESMPLSYSRAYGGLDQRLANKLAAAVQTPDDFAALVVRELMRRHPGMYPRNPAGTGYVILDEATKEPVRLPNFEDPKNLLVPERFVVGAPEDWHRMPLPQGFTWFTSENYPRCMYWGNSPEHPAPDESDELEEVRHGYLSRGFGKKLAAAPLQGVLDWRGLNGASPGLVVPYLRGDEHVRLGGLSVSGPIEFALPGARPRVEIVRNGKAMEVVLNMHSLLIEPDEPGCSIVWGAHAYATSPDEFPERLPGPDIDHWDMLQGYTVLVDGEEAPHKTIELPWANERAC